MFVPAVLVNMFFPILVQHGAVAEHVFGPVALGVDVPAEAVDVRNRVHASFMVTPYSRREIFRAQKRGEIFGVAVIHFQHVPRSIEMQYVSRHAEEVVRLMSEVDAVLVVGGVLRPIGGVGQPFWEILISGDGASLAPRRRLSGPPAIDPAGVVPVALEGTDHHVARRTIRLLQLGRRVVEPFMRYLEVELRCRLIRRKLDQLAARIRVLFGEIESLPATVESGELHAEGGIVSARGDA